METNWDQAETCERINTALENRADNVDGITPYKAKLYKTAMMKETGEFVAIRAAGHFAYNHITKREEHIFNVYDHTIFGTDVLRGQFYQNALDRFTF